MDGSGYLRGTYANVVNDEAGRAHSSSHSFQYGTSNTHFDEVNLYYHIDTFRNNFIEGLEDGSHALGFTQITAHAHSTHYVYGDVNAWFSRIDRELYFGNASSDPFINNFAREDKVVYHEYSHAVIYDQNSGIESVAEEEGAISEGVPDYFAGAYTGRALIGEYVGITRDMASPEIGTYSEYQDEAPVSAHAGGEFFSSVLWDLRNASGIDPAKVDWLVYAALSYVSDNPTFYEFRSAMLAENNAEYNGADKCKIQNAFAERGVGTSCLRVYISGPTTVDSGELETWTASAANGLPPYDYQWAYYDYDRGRWWDISGSNDSELQWAFHGQSSYTAMLRVTVTDESRGAMDIHTVNVVGSGGGGGGGCNALASNTPARNALPPPGCLKGPAADEALPEAFALDGNVPNPVSGRTMIRYAVPEASEVRLVVYDVVGREVARLVDGLQAAGFHEVRFDTSTLPSGVYLYRMTAGKGFTDTGRMVVVK